MKKRFMALMAVFVAAIFLAGCGGNEPVQLELDQVSGESILDQIDETGKVDLEGLERQEGTIPNRDGEKKGGPGSMSLEESLIACSEKEEGDSCSFAVGNENEEELEISGICQTTPQLEELSCMPERKDRPDRRPVSDE